MNAVTYTLEDQVAVVSLNSGENRFNNNFLDVFTDVLNEVEEKTEATALVVTSTHEKIFSNGIDLDWLGPIIMSGDTETAKGFFYRLNTLFKTIVTSPMICIASISGHAFAGGAILASAFDFRLMRSDRGFFCLPEIDLGIPLLPGMLALLRSAIPQYKLDEMVYAGSRLTAEECLAHHIITKACPRDDLLEESLALARTFTKERKTVAEMKKRYNKEIVQALEVEDVPYIEEGQLS